MSATAPTQRASSDALLSLPEDLVGRILFSGYLPISWWWTVNLILVCKKFKELGNKYIASVVNKERFVFDPFTQKPVFLGVLDIAKYAKNLVYLDLSFSADLDFTNPALVEMVLGLKTTLRSLSLRGARSCNEFLVSTVPHLEHLRYLNLSQTLVVDKGLITDFGALQLVKLKNLRWLNLSMTLITDVTIVELQRNCPFIEHLDLFGCSDLTDRSLGVICKWKLQVLDISACTKLTYKGFEKFCSPSAPIHHTLTVLACSFLHPNAPTGTTLKLLLTMPKLKKVDIRKRVEEVVAEKLLETARAQLERLDVVHADMASKAVLVPQVPSLRSLCPVLRWPYATIEL